MSDSISQKQNFGFEFGTELEASTSLFQRPLYRGTSGKLDFDFAHAVENETHLTWDLGAIMSTLSLGYALGTSTLFNEIKRRPWLSEVKADGSFRELPIPPHGRRWYPVQEIAAQLFQRLQREIEDVAKPYSQIYLLLSGGLDSRIVAGVVKTLLDKQRLQADVTAVTWGQANSRDVVLAQEVAQQLGFRWQHVVLGAEHVAENIEVGVRLLGATVSPINLHRMNWLVENCESNALVLAGSYGDSVGRSEYSKRTVLELRPMSPVNSWGLIRADLSGAAQQRCQEEITNLFQRAGDVPNYIRYEHQQQGHYMRGKIAQTMSVISVRCPVYQAFTASHVYQYMWSLHPSIRTDDVYRHLLKNLGRQLVNIPWARTNAALDRSRIDRTMMSANYHDYSRWTQEFLKQQLAEQGYENYLSSFEVLSFLDQKRFRDWISTLADPDLNIRTSGTAAQGTYLWLESLRRFSERLGPRVQKIHYTDIPKALPARTRSRTQIRQILSSIPLIRNFSGKIRRTFLRQVSRWRFPIDRNS
jgi:hypothetical protein